MYRYLHYESIIIVSVAYIGLKMTLILFIVVIPTDSAMTPDLLHEDLRVIGHHVPVHHGSEGDVVAGRLDVLVHQLPETLLPQAVHQLSHVPQGAAHLLGQDLGVHHGSVVDRPAGDGRATLSDGPLEQAYTHK